MNRGYFDERPCNTCPSNCEEDKGLFALHTELRGAKIAISPLRSHILFVKKGKLKLRRDCGELVCEQNQMILLVERCRFEVTVLENCEVLSLGFVRAFQTCDVIRIDQVKEMLSNYQYHVHSLELNGEMQSFIDSTIQFLKKDVNCINLHTAKQTELFVIFRYFYTAEQVFKFFHPIIDRNICFESLVKANYVAAKNVEELARLCGYNVHTFKKLFDRYFEESPYQWMIRQNAQRVKTMLMDLSIPIKVIVIEFSFTNQSHLNLFCKRNWGMTAKQLREELSQNIHLYNKPEL